jgi:hypothetical protein
MEDTPDEVATANPTFKEVPPPTQSGRVEDEEDGGLRAMIGDFGQDTITKAKTWWNFWGEC